MNLLTHIRSLFEPVLTALASDQSKVLGYLAAIKPAANADHGDYQANMAMAMANRAAGQKPPDVAKEIVAALGDNDELETPTVAGPGFINLRLTSKFLADAIQQIATDPKLGVPAAAKPRTFVIDLSGPNVAKPLHVGHLRSTIIGDALVRILRFVGHNVIGDNHLGDWGTQFGMLIYGYRNLRDEKKYAEDPVRELARLYIAVRKLDTMSDWISRGLLKSQETCPHLVSNGDQGQWAKEIVRWLIEGLKSTLQPANIRDLDVIMGWVNHGLEESQLVPESLVAAWSAVIRKWLEDGMNRSSESEDSEDEGEAIGWNPVKHDYRVATGLLHHGMPDEVSLWKQFMPACLEMLRPIYERLGVKIDYALGESFYNPMLAGVVDDMLKKGVAFESKGAVVIPNAKGVIPQTEEDSKKEEPPAIVRKRGIGGAPGAFTYTTTDLATIKYRVETWKPDAMLYVVGAPQALHFKTLFAQARRWNYPNVEFQHIQFGSMLGADRKIFSTRKGGALELMSLLDDAACLSLQKYEENSAARRAVGHKVFEPTDAEKAEIAEVVGVGAVKYADLSQSRTTDYVFDLDKMTATVGNTAAYMQYAYARCRSIFREGGVEEARFRANPPAVLFTHAAERALALQLLRFPEAVENAAADYLPHLITTYLWDLAKSYSVFFENCPVLKAESPELKDSRLLLVDLVGRVIKQALDLLGIRVVERM